MTTAMTDQDKAQELAHAIQALADTFLAKIPAAIQAMEDELNVLALDSEDPALWKSLHRRLHNMAGSAGMFDAPELGKRAKDLEIRINNLLKLEESNQPFNQPDLLELIDDYQVFINWVREEYVNNRK